MRGGAPSERSRTPGSLGHEGGDEPVAGRYGGGKTVGSPELLLLALRSVSKVSTERLGGGGYLGSLRRREREMA